MGNSSEARASALIQNPTFKAFMTENALSGGLLVNGNEDLPRAEGLSPMGLVAAKLARISEQTHSSRAFVLGYFFAEPRIPYGGTGTPAGNMMASLIGQLVIHMLARSVDVDLSCLSPAKWKRLQERDSKSLSVVFYELVRQLPAQSLLLCVLDEIALVETDLLHARDVDDAVRRLVRLVQGCDKIVFKLMVTCRGRAMGIGQYFAGSILEMDEDVEADDSAAWQIANMG